MFTEATWEGLFTFLVAQFDGILGLGFEDIAIGRVTPIWYTMLDIFIKLFFLGVLQFVVVMAQARCGFNQQDAEANYCYVCLSFI